MKKLFKRNKEAYDSYKEENVLWDDFDDWDDTEVKEEGENEEYYGEEGDSEEYYGEDEEAEEYYGEEEEAAEEYYGEEGDSEGYYGEDEETEEYYGEEGDSEEYYGEDEEAEEYYGEEGDSEEYYGEDEEAEEYYGEDEEIEEYYEEDEEEVLQKSAGSDSNIIKKLGYAFAHMSAMDRTVTITGILVLVLALVTGVFYISARTIDKQVSSFSTIGSQLTGITMIGEEGLTAVTDAELAKILASNDVEQEEEEPVKEYEETEYAKEVEVSLNMTSIEKDLKLKFVNTKTNKLIANVPFSVTVTRPDGKTETWIDDDMDGIIYKSGITPGEYSVAMDALTESKYADYGIVTSAKKVTVKKEIAYQKVEVTDEIKNESEINVSKEDTKENDTAVESTLSDTVGWVESTQTIIDAVYTAVPKTNVPDPMTVAKNTTFIRTAADTGLPTASPDTGTDTPASASPAPGTETPAPASPDTPPNTGAASPAPGTEQPGDASPSPTPTPAPTATPIAVTGITLDKTSLSLVRGGSESLNATVTPENAADKSVSFTSSDNTIVTVDNAGRVTAVQAGTATVTVSSNAVPGISASCQVSVTEPVESRTLVLSQNNITAMAGAQMTLTAAIQNSTAGGSTAGTIKAESNNTAVAEVVTYATAEGTATLTITPKSAGTAVITVSIEGTSITQTCTVTVGTRSMTLDKPTLSVLSGTAKEFTALVDGVDGEMKVETSDGNIATATVTTTQADGRTSAKVVVTGVAAGSATITVTHTAGGVAVKQTCTVTVVNRDNKLLDADKKPLYVLVAEGTYREATYADYYDASITTFYVMAENVMKYTGWQTIDGKLYYYDASGKKITGEQVIQGAKYTFASDGSLVVGNGTFGIDVSKWNGTIDWNAVKNSGVSYVIIRCGYRGSSTGVLVEDPKFRSNIKGATAAGIKVGVYFFSQAVNKSEAVEEASMVLELIKGYTISYPVFLDVEASGGRGDKIDTATRTEVIKAFCETIQNSGYTAGVYANKTWLSEKIDTSQLSRYKIWLAQYAAAPTYSGRYDMWQYKSTGKVTGISGDVDLNLSYLGY